jgi:hypothetical protein
MFNPPEFMHVLPETIVFNWHQTSLSNFEHHIYAASTGSWKYCSKNETEINVIEKLRACLFTQTKRIGVEIFSKYLETIYTFNKCNF